MKGIYAVITGDVVGSTLIKDDYRDILYNISFDIREFVDSGYRFEIYRGDSFQAITSNIQKSLITSLLLRAGFRSHAPENKPDNSWDIRLAIGLGKINQNYDEEVSLGSMNGEAFQLSGRAIDDMKEEKERLRIVTSNDQLNTFFKSILPLLDDMVGGWSYAQSRAVYTHLLRPTLTQSEIGKEIRTSQRSVSKILDASRIELMKPFINHYEQLLLWNLNK